MCLSTPGDLSRGLYGLLLLPSERLPPCAAVGCGGVQEGSEQGRIRDPAGALQPAEKLIPRGGELIRAKRGKLGVRQGPTRLPEAFNGNSGGPEHERLNGLQLPANVGEAVGDLREVGGAAVERAGLPLSTNRRVPGSEDLEMCHRFGRERDGVLRVKALGDVEARRDVSSSTRFIPSWGESLGAPSAVFFIGVLNVFSFTVLLVLSFFFSGLRGIVGVPWGPSSNRNLRGTTRSRADRRGIGIGDGLGLGEGAAPGGDAAIPYGRGGAGRERGLNASLDETSDQLTRPVVESRERVVFS
jgi:hypothetical protein